MASSAQAQRLAFQRARGADAEDRLSLGQQAAPGDNSQFAERRTAARNRRACQRDQLRGIAEEKRGGEACGMVGGQGG